MPKKDGEAPLGIVVNGEYLLSSASKRHSKVESGGALPHSLFSVCYCDDGSHKWFFLVSLQWYMEDFLRSKGLIPFLLGCRRLISQESLSGLGCRLSL
jgi:hypothetical protein